MGRESHRDAKQNALKLWGIVLVCMLICGCGYSLASSRFSDEYRTIAVPAFDNKSFEPEIQIRVTNFLIREMEADGRYRVVDDSAMADLVLRGSIEEFDARAISFSTEDNIGQFRILLTAEVELEDAKSGEIICKLDPVRGGDFYQTVGGRTREEALDEASEALVEAIIYGCLDNPW